MDCKCIKDNVCKFKPHIQDALEPTMDHPGFYDGVPFWKYGN